MGILGFSDATLAVVKRGPEEVHEQGLLADHIGSRVCPQILRFVPGGYEMELLEPSPVRSAAMLGAVMDKLRTEVWSRESYRHWDSGWLEPLKAWVNAKGVYWLHDLILRCYPEEPTDDYCLIHGDPTMANLMMRDRDFVITDPMPRLEYRKEIPNRVEVDLGKLLQSAVGWERMLGCESSCWDQPDLVLRAVPGPARSTVMLWGAIHLARVGLRAPSRGKPRIASWATASSQDLVRMAMREFA